ncbi:SusE domain-containing protein [Pontibacter silvestris]|uniref:SusE domain-containing protein n=1 Tax=Pontibacter silvestris TaxID=2305183 RepID=A0ABW4X2C1_9BACT|nr:SusE domain-containing protein [Pontibacter silvestris]MCC9136030.1 SusE domain-containing protein [Pontibacter silvestris]
MKIWLKQILILCVCSLALFSCEKDEDRVYLNVGASPELTASASEVVLNSEEEAEDAVTFTWTAPAYGFKAAVDYSLQFAVQSTDFANPVELSVGEGRESTLTVQRLNTVANQLGLTAGTAAEIEVRVESNVASTVEPLYSSPITLTVTPYFAIIEYPSLFVPGSYQGWDPATAGTVASVNDDQVYEGYFYFPDAVNEFKITPEASWDVAYGDVGNGTSGEIVEGGESNLKVNDAGYYLLQVDLNENTWSATNTTWGVTGDATAGGWDAADQNLVYDPATGVWSATLELSAGELKFRANNDWAIAYGDVNEDLLLDTEEDNNISVSEAGTYEVTLDLSVPGNYRYSLRRL